MKDGKDRSIRLPGDKWDSYNAHATEKGIPLIEWIITRLDAAAKECGKVLEKNQNVLEDPLSKEGFHPCRYFISDTPQNFTQSQCFGGCSVRMNRVCSWAPSKAKGCPEYSPKSIVR